jgi:hypothetical protein
MALFDTAAAAAAQPAHACAEMGAAARRFFLDNDTAFPQRLAAALQPQWEPGPGRPAVRRRLAAALFAR